MFPQAAAIVHQVGIGTLSQALRAGKPQLLLPVGMDQPDNARRAASSASGGCCRSAVRTDSTLARELAALLDDPAVASAAQSLGPKLQRTDGAASAADAIIAQLR